MSISYNYLISFSYRIASILRQVTSVCVGLGQLENMLFFFFSFFRILVSFKEKIYLKIIIKIIKPNRQPPCCAQWIWCFITAEGHSGKVSLFLRSTLMNATWNIADSHLESQISGYIWHLYQNFPCNLAPAFKLVTTFLQNHLHTYFQVPKSSESTPNHESQEVFWNYGGV